MTAELILFGALGLVVYVYAGYPLLVRMRGHLGGRATKAGEIAPHVSIIIAAHNEAAVIAAKLENTLVLDYPPEQREILVASDGSTDDTDVIVARYVPQGVRLLRLPRCGKMRAIERAARAAQGEILVLTDANIQVEPQALRALVAHFEDQEVGGVCGCKKVRHAAGTAAVQGESLYWRYEQFLKRWESRAGSTLAADGSLYAIRRQLFQAPEDPAQADDFTLSARIPLRGYRLVFEPRAVAWEAAPVSARQEFWRKVRVANHSLRAIGELRAALNPWRTGFYAVQMWSHKLLRYFLPVPLALALAASAALDGASPWYGFLFAAHLVFYSFALIGATQGNRRWGRHPVFHGPFYFCLAHSAAFLGALSLLQGHRTAAWEQHREAGAWPGKEPVKACDSGLEGERR